MAKAPQLSIVIGTYKTRDLTKTAIESIIRYLKDISWEIIVIDDASNDRTFEILLSAYPQIKVIRNRKNLGYCKTYNKGTRIAKGKYILHVNSDVLFTERTKIAKVISFLEKNHEVGILGNKVLKSDGKLDPPSRHAVPTLKNTIAQSLGIYKLFPQFKNLNYYMTYLGDDEMTEVGGVGAFMITRRELFEDIGMLDEKFVLYCQDSDFCYRAYKAGWKLIYFPNSEVIHFRAGTSKRFKVRTQINFHRDMWYYFKKHYLKSLPFFVGYLLFIALLLRFVLFTVLEFLFYISSVLKKQNIKKSFLYTNEYRKF